jgi:hypothetical protein
MNCLAIWYKHKPLTSKEKLNVVLHVNLWKLNFKKKESKKDHKQFLDIGINIPDTSNVANINIYIPFRIAQKEISDLGKYFQDNSKLVATIFNEEWSTKSSAQSKTLKIEDSNDPTPSYRPL